jgi:hypothetical protein
VLEERLLAPGDGTYLHYPLRALAWAAWRRGDLPSWNPGIFGGTPLLAGYRAGVFFPLMPALSTMRPFVAFQWLVLLSLGAAGVVTFVYLRRLGANAVGAYVGGLAFALGPYLVNHLGDTATVVAAPMLPLLLLAAESHAREASALRAAGVSLALALLLLAGSPEAARAGVALLLGRLVLLHARPGPGGPRPLTSVLAVLAGLMLAAPQLLPTLYAWLEAGKGTAGIATSEARALQPGAFGLVLRYVSHTPAPALATIALPLILSRPAVRALVGALLLCAALRYGRGPLAAPGTLALAFDLALSLLAGLSLSALWEARRQPGGRQLRSYLVAGGLASALALSIAAAMTGPLAPGLASAVGLLALSFILLVSLYPSPHGLRASLFLLPLTVSFLLQPQGREAWRGALTRRELFFGTPAREAVDRALGPRRSERLLTLAREWPRSALDLGFGNLASVIGRSSAVGYDPLVPLRTREAFPGMSTAGLLPGAFFRSSAARLERLGVRLVQAPAEALVVTADAQGLGEALDLVLEAGRPRLLPVPSGFATEVRLATWMDEAVGMPQGEVVAWVNVRLASGRELRFPLRAGLETAEWAIDRADVRPLVRHRKPAVAWSFREEGADFEGHRYLALLDLGGRYQIDGVRLERRPGPAHLYISKAGVGDGRRRLGLSLVSAYLSDSARLREITAGPLVRLFAVRGSVGPARVVDEPRRLDTDEDVRIVLAADAGYDPRREALLTTAEALRVGLADGLGEARAGRAELVRVEGGQLEVRAEGPGLLVLAVSFDPGWKALVDGKPAPVLRVNDVQMGVVLEAGLHRVTLRQQPRGLVAGLAAAAASALGLLAAITRENVSASTRV